MIILSKEKLSQAANYLKQGKTLVFPTASSYGLGCDVTNQAVVDKIFQIKQRANNKPLLIVVPNISMAKKYIVWDKLTEQLASKYWPGPLTLVQKVLNNNLLAKGVMAVDNTVAIRVSDHPVPIKLASILGKPIVATSANVSDRGNIYSSKQVQDIFAEQEIAPDALFDYGILPNNPVSTIVSLVNKKVEVLRPGKIKIVKFHDESTFGDAALI